MAPVMDSRGELHIVLLNHSLDSSLKVEDVKVENPEDWVPKPGWLSYIISPSPHHPAQNMIGYVVPPSASKDFAYELTRMLLLSLYYLTDICFVFFPPLFFFPVLLFYFIR